MLRSFLDLPAGSVVQVIFVMTTAKVRWNNNLTLLGLIYMKRIGNSVPHVTVWYHKVMHYEVH